MRNIVLILGILLLNFCFALDSETPLLFPASSSMIETSQSENSLINVDNMKRSKRIEKAKDEAASVPKRKIKLDSDEIMRERALDFTTKQNNALLPAF